MVVAVAGFRSGLTRRPSSLPPLSAWPLARAQEALYPSGPTGQARPARLAPVVDLEAVQSRQPPLGGRDIVLRVSQKIGQLRLLQAGLFAQFPKDGQEGQVLGTVDRLECMDLFDRHQGVPYGRDT